MQPVDHFQLCELIEALQRRLPWIEDLKPAHRPVDAALPRGLLPRSPRRANAPDKNQPCIARRRRLNRDFPWPHITLPSHGLFQSSEMFSDLITPDQRVRSASMNSVIALALRGRSGGNPIFSSAARKLVSLRARLRLAVILSATSSGVLAGAAMPYQTLTA